MNPSFSVSGLSTGIIRPGDPFTDRIIAAAASACGGFSDGDILVLAETAVATAEGNVVRLDTVTPSPRAMELAERYHMDPRTVEVVLSESDSIVGGIPGFLLCMKQGTLLPNAGVDASNAPPGCIVPLPKDPDGSAVRIKGEIFRRCHARIGVIVADSRTHAMRLGCSGVAIGCAGITSVIDDRGRSDLFGRKLEVTKRAVADNIASAAELVMGEADECTPAALVRGLGMTIGDECGVDTIDADECLFMGVFRNCCR
ncbi:coenzyme F420-0:L-glutamate ligase [Methanoregula sp.]|uniref:coenzyme F420-0:L-glutamate ligase n=1 Tax=Methanoregula sp. TaxID=2052170 RepID=UPI002CC8C1BD|nr:coenzyme F420-0:L-glutamate ligase [Methanoregula sp.]HVP97531.1 coenzyme F420-0:L-glutamate ligase [Methanoregula sp.]